MYEYRSDKQRLIRQDEELQRRVEAVRQTEDKRKELEAQGWAEVGRVREKQELRHMKALVLDEHIENLKREVSRLDPAPLRGPQPTEAEEYVANRLAAKDKRHKVSSDAPWGNPPLAQGSEERIVPLPTPLTPPTSPPQIPPDPKYLGTRTLDKFSLQAFLGKGNNLRNDREAIVNPEVQALWEKERQRIVQQREMDLCPESSALAEWRRQQNAIVAKRGAQGPPVPIRLEDDDYFEEAPAPPNEVGRLTDMHMKFRLDGQTLNLTPAHSSLSARCTALREFLSLQLGGKVFHDSYDILSDVRHMDNDVGPEVCSELAEQVGGTQGYMELVVQLIICEEMLQNP